MNGVAPILLRTCAQCREEKPAPDFIGRRGLPVTYCSACRTKYYKGAPHEPGEANVGPRRSVRPYQPKRSRTESRRDVARLVREERRVHLHVVNEFEGERPKTRGDCVDGERPCPWVSCKHNLFLDVGQETGGVTYNFPGQEPDEIEADRSCALDIADRGGASLLDVGELYNVSRERIRQIESKALTLLRRRSSVRAHAAAELLEYCEKPDFAAAESGSAGRAPVWSQIVDEAPGAPPEAFAEAQEDEPPTRVSFFAEGDRADELVCTSVWNIFARDSNHRALETGNPVFTCRPPGAAKLAEYHRRRREKEKTMGNGAINGGPGLSPWLASVLAAHKELSAGGDKPSVLDIALKARATGDTDRKKCANVYQALALLRKKGLLADGGGRAKSAPKPIEQTEPVAKSRAPRSPRQPKPPPPPASGVAPAGAAIDVLRSELATVERRADKLRDALAILSELDHGVAS